MVAALYKRAHGIYYNFDFLSHCFDSDVKKISRTANKVSSKKTREGAVGGAVISDYSHKVFNRLSEKVEKHLRGQKVSVKIFFPRSSVRRALKGQSNIPLDFLMRMKP